jgi:hypothetical protein
LLGGVEGYDANRVAVLPADQIGNDGFKISSLDACLPIGLAKPSAKVVEHKVDGWIGARNNRGGPAHKQLHATSMQNLSTKPYLVPTQNQGRDNASMILFHRGMGSVQ